MMMVTTQPSITQEIFKGQPDWVISAAVCSNGMIIGFSCQAEYLVPTGKFNSWTAIEGVKFTAKHLGQCSFMDNWSTSAIDRL